MYLSKLNLLSLYHGSLLNSFLSEAKTSLEGLIQWFNWDLGHDHPLIPSFLAKLEKKKSKKSGLILFPMTEEKHSIEQLHIRIAWELWILNRLKLFLSELNQNLSGGDPGINTFFFKLPRCSINKQSSLEPVLYKAHNSKTEDFIFKFNLKRKYNWKLGLDFHLENNNIP